MTGWLSLFPIKSVLQVQALGFKKEGKKYLIRLRVSQKNVKFASVVPFSNVFFWLKRVLRNESLGVLPQTQICIPVILFLSKQNG